MQEVVTIFLLSLTGHFGCSPFTYTQKWKFRCWVWVVMFHPSNVERVLGRRSLTSRDPRTSTFAHMHAKSLKLCPTLQPHRWQPTRLLCPWDSPDKNTGVGCHCLLRLHVLAWGKHGNVGLHFFTDNIQLVYLQVPHTIIYNVTLYKKKVKT